VYQTWPNSAAAKFIGYGFDVQLSPAVELRCTRKSRHAGQHDDAGHTSLFRRFQQTTRTFHVYSPNVG
jgi:hypothetical protein